MTGLTVPVVQINSHHTKGASAILARGMAVMQTAIALVQELWLLNNAIKGLSGSGKIISSTTQEKIRTCIVTKSLNAILMPQFSNGNITVVQVRLNLDEGTHRDVLMGSVYMPYDAKDLPPQREVKELMKYAEERRLEVLLGCDANSHHVGWGSTGINPRGESLHEFVMDSKLIILNRGTEPTFMDCRRRDRPNPMQLRFALEHKEKGKWGRNPRSTNWTSYRKDLGTILKKAPSRFNTKQDLEAASQFVSDAILEAYEANCPLKRKQVSTKVPW
ncbi:uncharacterized protein LOC116850996 [Odontomachus brunneus]|uniref:uncharacterized protein LOC116850996 n=1 Tax=Odontomachus brunneus TaxID=486640 RepID=UPI0013F1D0CA|nr:uncharacterized protein LOC116850996 [Odontomachus brunneus]